MSEYRHLLLCRPTFSYITISQVSNTAVYYKLKISMISTRRLEPVGGNNRYINEEVPTRQNHFDPVVEKCLVKDIPVSEKVKDLGSKRYARGQCFSPTRQP